MSSYQYSNKYNLVERTTKFGEDILNLCKALPQDIITKPLINQIIRSATSVGANYMEASNASSRKDFRNKIFICKKESQETQHWIQMLITSVPEKSADLKRLWDECHQLLLIFQKSINTITRKDNDIKMKIDT